MHSLLATVRFLKIVSLPNGKIKQGVVSKGNQGNHPF